MRPCSRSNRVPRWLSAWAGWPGVESSRARGARWAHGGGPKRMLCARRPIRLDESREGATAEAEPRRRLPPAARAGPGRAAADRELAKPQGKSDNGQIRQWSNPTMVKSDNGQIRQWSNPRHMVKYPLMRGDSTARRGWARAGEKAASYGLIIAVQTPILVK